MAHEAPLLRTQLLKWLIGPLLLLLVADTFVSYRVALRFAERAYDVALIEIVREVALHVKRGASGIDFDMPEAARRVLFTDPSDSLYYEIVTPEGRLVAGQPVTPAPMRSRAAAGEALYDGGVNGSAVRVAELRIGSEDHPQSTIAYARVAETKNRRNALAHEILLSVVVPQVLLILIACGLVWVGVVRGLGPLRTLQQAVASRTHRDRAPLLLDDVPGEVRPVMNEINGLLERLDEALTLQNRFTADAAHQLKTPVAGLQAQLELAMRESDPARLRENLAKLEAGLDRLSRLVSQLLALARNEPDAARHMALGEVDLNGLALESASAWVPDALKKSIDLGFDGTDAPLPVRGDVTRLRELLDNLIDNAIRYSREGGRVTVRVLSTPEPTVAVSDDGPGIPPEERQRIFERFHRRLGAGGADGSGLGLAIAQEIARIHGGQIDLREDVDGVGNTFSVSLPPLRRA
jgi:two-component system sensor histidine kinase TctE